MRRNLMWAAAETSSDAAATHNISGISVQSPFTNPITTVGMMPIEMPNQKANLLHFRHQSRGLRRRIHTLLYTANIAERIRTTVANASSNASSLRAPNDSAR